MHSAAHIVEGTPTMESEAARKCSLYVDTFSAPPAEQFDLFRSWWHGICEPEPPQTRGQSYRAHQLLWDLGTFSFMHLELSDANSQRFRHLKKPVVDSWYVRLPLYLGKNFKRVTGKLEVKSLAAPSESASEGNTALLIFMPPTLPCIQSSKVELREEASSLLEDYMVLLDRSLKVLRAEDIPHIAIATTSLLTACLTESRDDIVASRSAIDAVIIERACKMIKGQLRSRDLTSDMLCRELGVSRSRLYRIFEPCGGVSAYIRRQRLIGTRDMLADRSDGRPISAVAEEWGFTDPSTYSRMFRKEFGITPKEARMEGWQGRQPMAQQQNGVPPDGPYSLSDILLRNHFGI